MLLSMQSHAHIGAGVSSPHRQHVSVDAKIIWVDDVVGWAMFDLTLEESEGLGEPRHRMCHVQRLGASLAS